MSGSIDGIYAAAWLTVTPIRKLWQWSATGLRTAHGRESGSRRESQLRDTPVTSDAKLTNIHTSFLITSFLTGIAGHVEKEQAAQIAVMISESCGQRLAKTDSPVELKPARLQAWSRVLVLTSVVTLSSLYGRDGNDPV
jgi:hypothetical protein